MSDAGAQTRQTMLRKTVNDLQTAADLKISKRCFKDITGDPNTFYCNIDSEVLLRIITKGGGLLVDDASKASYILSEDPSMDEGELPTQFIIDCVIKNKLLDKDTYISSKKAILFRRNRPKKQLNNCENHLQDVSPRNGKENTENPSESKEDEPEVFQSTSNNREMNILSIDVQRLPQTSTNPNKNIAINDDEAMDWFFDQAGPEIKNKSISPERKRKKYTLDEDLAIIRHLIKNKIYTSTGGNTVWRTMEHQRVTTHSWGSMKARLKVILANMNSYVIPAIWKADLTGNRTKKWKDAPVPVVEVRTRGKKRKSNDKTDLSSASRNIINDQASCSGISKDLRNAKKGNINSSNNGDFDFSSDENDDYVKRVNSSFTKFLSSSPSPKTKQKISDYDGKSKRRRITSSTKSTSIITSPSPNKSTFISQTLGHERTLVSHKSDSELTKPKTKRSLSFIEDDDTIEECESPPVQKSKSCDRLSFTRDSVEREKSRQATKRTNQDIVTETENTIAEEDCQKKSKSVGGSNSKKTKRSRDMREGPDPAAGSSVCPESPNLIQTQSSLQYGSFETIQVPARKKQRSIKTGSIQQRKNKPYREEASSLTSGVEFDESDSSFNLSTVYEFVPQKNSTTNNCTTDSELEENVTHNSKPNSHHTRRNKRNKEPKKHKSSHETMQNPVQTSTPNLPTAQRGESKWSEASSASHVSATKTKKMPFSIQFKISFLMDEYHLSLEEATYLLEKQGGQLHRAVQWFLGPSSGED